MSPLRRAASCAAACRRSITRRSSCELDANITVLLLGVSLVGLTSGCKKKAAVVPPRARLLRPMEIPLPAPQAPAASITAEPSMVEAGQPVTLKWSTTNATEVTISGLGVSGCRGETGSPSGEGHYLRTRRERSRRLGYRVRDCQRHGAAASNHPAAARGVQVSGGSDSFGTFGCLFRLRQERHP